MSTVTSQRGKKMVLGTIARLGIENSGDNRVAVLDLARDGVHPDAITAAMVAERLAPPVAPIDNFTIQWESWEYHGFATYEAAREVQREREMTGSVIVPSAESLNGVLV